MGAPLADVVRDLVRHVLALSLLDALNRHRLIAGYLVQEQELVQNSYINEY
jgi:hypothetical protein